MMIFSCTGSSIDFAVPRKAKSKRNHSAFKILFTGNVPVIILGFSIQRMMSPLSLKRHMGIFSQKMMLKMEKSVKKSPKLIYEYRF